MDKIQAEKRITAIEEEAAELRKIIETDDKPALGNGDYGYLSRQSWIKIQNEVYWLDSAFKDISTHPDSFFLPSRIGNLVDDLKRNQEDLEEFEINGDCGGQLNISYGSHGRERVRFRVACTEHNFSLNEATKIHQKLGQLIATAKRRQAKGGVKWRP